MITIGIYAIIGRVAALLYDKAYRDKRLKVKVKEKVELMLSSKKKKKKSKTMMIKMNQFLKAEVVI